MRRSLHPCRKLPQPVLVPDKPWEGNRVYVGTVHRDPYTGEFKLWYMSYSYLAGQPDDHEQGRDPKLRGRFGYRLHANSTDGVHWRKPDLGRYLHGGSKRNNIVYDYGSTVYVEPPGSDEENPYKLLGSLSPIADSNERHGYWAAVSPNGLDWRDVAQAPVIPGADTITLTRNPRTVNTWPFISNTSQSAAIGAVPSGSQPAPISSTGPPRASFSHRTTRTMPGRRERSSGPSFTT